MWLEAQALPPQRRGDALSGPTSRKRCGMGRVRYSVVVSYQPMSLAELARFIAAEPDFDTRWRLVVEFLKEYHQERGGARRGLRARARGPTGVERGDLFLGGLAEPLARRDGKDAPGWSA